MINPCAYKGISIFLELAKRLSAVKFAVVPTWGTTSANLAALEALPNMQVLAPADDINNIFAQTRVLLVPSLWGEAFGQIAVEAMLRGIPVLASNVGGLSEAKLGVDYLLPVRPIERYEEALNDRMMPLPVVPEQSIGPWFETLRGLLSDRRLYERLSMASREAALAFVSGVGIEPYQTYLEGLEPASQTDHNGDAMRERKQSSTTRGILDNLSPKMRSLLALQLRAKD
jgi:glycosyltransferase involved in cell wall biosynthesis